LLFASFVLPLIPPSVTEDVEKIGRSGDLKDQREAAHISSIVLVENSCLLLKDNQCHLSHQW